MPVKGYRPPDVDRVTTDTDVLDDLVQRHVREDLLPMIAQKSRNALNCTPVYIEYFQRLHTGRRCSCFTVETDAGGQCPACFGTGIVGGYTKRGTKTEVFDVTYQNVVAANIQADYSNSTRPVYWTLVDTAVYGTLEFSVQVNKNCGLLDVYEIRDYQPTGTLIQYFVRSDEEINFVAMTRAALEQRLTTSFLHFKIVIKRKNPASPLPKLQLFRFSYRLLRLSCLRADIPRVTESKTFEELGLYQSWTNQSYFLDNTLKNCSTDDFLINLQDNTRWRVNEVKGNAPLNITLSWDLTCRLVLDTEPYAMVPAGVVDSSVLPSQFIRSIQTDKEIVEQAQLNPGHLRLPGNRTDQTNVNQSPVAPGLADVAKPSRNT